MRRISCARLTWPQCGSSYEYVMRWCIGAPMSTWLSALPRLRNKIIGIANYYIAFDYTAYWEGGTHWQPPTSHEHPVGGAGSQGAQGAHQQERGYPHS